MGPVKQPLWRDLQIFWPHILYPPFTKFKANLPFFVCFLYWGVSAVPTLPVRSGLGASVPCFPEQKEDPNHLEVPGKGQRLSHPSFRTLSRDSLAMVWHGIGNELASLR